MTQQEKNCIAGADFRTNRKLFFIDIQLTIVVAAHVSKKESFSLDDHLDANATKGPSQFSATEEAEAASNHMIIEFMKEVEASGGYCPGKTEYEAWLSESYGVRRLAFRYNRISDCIRFHSKAGLEQLKNHLVYFVKYFGETYGLTKTLRRIIDDSSLWVEYAS